MVVREVRVERGEIVGRAVRLKDCGEGCACGGCDIFFAIN